jgi:hypothetical protein
MKILMVLGALALGGCVAVPEPGSPEQKVFGRLDCRRLAEGPELRQDFSRAEAICVGRAQASAAAGSATVHPYGYGLSGAIATGIEQGLTERRIGEATVISCMAEQGYLYRTRSDHEAICATLSAAKKN